LPRLVEDLGSSVFTSGDVNTSSSSALFRTSGPAGSVAKTGPCAVSDAAASDVHADG
jgi:hypothetical protein